MDGPPHEMSSMDYIRQFQAEQADRPPPRFLQPTQSSKAHRIFLEAELKANRIKDLRRHDTDLSYKRQMEKQLRRLESTGKKTPSRPGSAVPPSTPQPPARERPAITPEPFQLRSMTRHEQYSESFKQQMEVEAQEEERNRNFRARRVNGRFRDKDANKNVATLGGGRFAAPSGPPQQIKEKKSVTVGVAPYITSEDRLAARKALQERYKEKEKMAEQERKEKEDAEQAAEEARLAEERKQNKFRARQMPDFTKVWSPAKDDKWEPTKPKEFSLETDKRYGKADKQKEGRAGAYILSPDSAYDPLQLHLRQPARPKSAAA